MQRPPEPSHPSRRTLVAASGALGLAAAAPAARAAAQPGEDAAWLQAVLERFAGFGGKASGGPGDEASGAWLEDELRGAGYACRRQAFEVPFLDPRRVTLAADDSRADLIAHVLGPVTGAAGVSGPLRLAAAGGDLSGAIALVTLPHKRWVTLVDPMAAQPLEEALRRGAAAAVLVTTGPTGEAIALNVSPHRPGPARPVAILAPKDAAPFLAAAAEGRPATLTVDADVGRRPAWNLIARLDRQAPKTLVISTPRSGWFGCAAERGSGLAVWLSLARWLAGADPGVNVELVCTSGHEFEYLGGEHYLEHAAPRPEATALWVHVGASTAARDWHEFGRLRPLPSADPQRVLTATRDVIDRVRPAFAGVTGLEAVLEATAATAGGEMTNVLKAGYATAIGQYGVHRYFHTRADDLGCTSGELVRPVAAAFRAGINACLTEAPRA
ncbi:hypothetical protein [Phenylobacterium sp.]|uniref:hypothetical protein n=1 Tax=Phenylobacterium sp. TaxID=1871053 RepID=UPI002FE246E1